MPKQRKRRSGTSQQRLPGVAKEVPAIEAAAEEYVKARDTRMSLTEQEVEAQAGLVTAMKTAKLDVYRTVAGLTCTLIEGTTKVKVRAAEQDGDEAVVE